MYRSQHYYLKLFLWLCLVCSTEQNHRAKRIAGASLVKTDLSKIVVSLRARSEQMYFGDSHFCTGCMLNDIFVLTSAQCVTYKNNIVFQPRDFIVMAGNVYRLNSTVSTIPMVVDFLVVHVNFTMTSYSDIAILRTQPYEGAIYAPGIDVAVEMLFPPPYGTKCITLGWGRLFKVSVLSLSLYLSIFLTFLEWPIGLRIDGA